VRPHRLHAPTPGLLVVAALRDGADLGLAIEARQPQCATEWAAVFSAEMREMRRMLEVCGWGGARLHDTCGEGVGWVGGERMRWDVPRALQG
jgi:hypothetical protein